MVDIQYYVSSGIQHSESQFLKVILHLQLLYNIGYIFCAEQYVPVGYLFSTQWFVPLNSLPLSCLFPLSLPTANLQFGVCVYESVFFNIFISLSFNSLYISDIIQYLSLFFFFQGKLFYLVFCFYSMKDSLNSICLTTFQSFTSQFHIIPQ